MRQLFILKQSTVEATATPLDLSKLNAGEVLAWEGGEETALAAAPTKDWYLAYGRPNSVPVIVEVGAHANIVKSLPQDGTKFKASIIIPTPEQGLNYTIVMIKTGVCKHERNQYSVTACGTKYKTAEALANELKKQLDGKNEKMELNLDISIAGAAITVEAKDYQGWEMQAGDDLFSTTTTEMEGSVVKAANKACLPTQDAAWLRSLASECAQNRGFNNTYRDGDTIYPGYPMEVEDTTYVVYTIHHHTHRKAGKQLDEAVWQDTIIAVPQYSEGDTAHPMIAKLDAILK